MSAASAMALSCDSPSTDRVRASLLHTPQTAQVQSTERRANLFRSSDDTSSDPIAPTPSVGMKPIIANRTVRTM